MANIRVDLTNELKNGQSVVFKAPCDCTAVTGLAAYYHDGSEVKSKTFSFKDAHGNNLTGLGNLFAQGAYVKVVLDTTKSVAYIQNADTNSYIEGQFSKINSNLTAVSNRIKVKTKTLSVTSTGVVTVTDTDFKTLDGSFPIAACNILYQGYPCVIEGISINGTTGGIQISTDKTSGTYAFQIIAYNEKGFVN